MVEMLVLHWPFFVAVLSLMLLVGINLRLGFCLAGSPKLVPPDPDPSMARPIPADTLTVILPAYNEAENIQPCIRAIVASTQDPIHVIVVDDQSQDATWTLLQELAQELHDPRLHLVAGQDRPPGWLGKTWACHQGSQKATTPYLLFIDCDVRLQPGSLESMVALAQASPPGLISVGPQVQCGCLAEWLVQPLMMAILAVGYDLAAVNDPQRQHAFAFGPIMFFHRQAYQAIGGHAAVRDQVVEDVALAGLIKGAGWNLKQVLGGSLAQVRMYTSGSQLWEGWTKNWFLGLHKRLELALAAVFGILLVTVIPWASLVVGGLLRDPWLASLGGLGIAVQVGIRWQLQTWAGLPMRYLWLTWLGGLVTASIVVASVYKTLTGRGWTWRGRSLRLGQSGSP